QFGTPARRFASNGYPVGHVDGIDYDSTFASENFDAVYAKIDRTVEELRARTGSDKVELVGHSLGTFVSQQYLSNPARAARVAHYVNIDGAGATALPGGVPTLAVWAEGDPARTVAGATNVQFAHLSHTEAVTA
nr:alpha/beta fold hydrolase [Micromonospora sp. DSM 115978]